MSKPIIVIVDTDENYLATLESKFLEVLDERVELEIISDVNYFKDFFSTPKTVEMVVIDEKIYTPNLLKHNIANLYMLTEKLDIGNTQELTVTRVFKYSGIKEIFNELLYRSKDKLLGNGDGNRDNKTTQIISCFSAVGGCGKTCLSMALAESLALNHQNVLYVSTESIQGFAHFLNEKTGMSNAGYRAMREDEENVYEATKPFIRKEVFSYVPPFFTTLDSVNLEEGIYKKLIVGAKASGEYDYVIVDIDAGYSITRMELLECSDKVLMIVEQDANSLLKTEILLRSIDLQDKEKYMFICNKYNEKQDNAYLSSSMQQKFPISEYVENVTDKLCNVEDLAHLSSMKKLAYMFI